MKHVVNDQTTFAAEAQGDPARERFPALIEGFRYRPEVDGMRAVAIIAVLLYHAGLGLPGGFMGVDVFLVISGYLITSQIVGDLESCEFTLVRFWERRVRRILPAAVVMVSITLAAGWFLLLPDAYSRLAGSAAWQAVFGANFYFWITSDYFTSAAGVLPLLHTWSLAVEEQFYLLFPVILWACYRLLSLRKRTAYLALFAAAAVASLTLSVAAVRHRPLVAFYLLPGRAWELLMGSFVALLPASVSPSRVAWRNVADCLGIAAILGPCFLYTRGTPFPGLAAIPPCLGTALIIWAGRIPLPDGHRRLPVERLLASGPVVFVGLISYSLYLWHWPLFAATNYLVFGPQPLVLRVSLAALAVLLAVISWRIVETPLRMRRVLPSRTAIFLGGALGTGVVLSVATVIHHEKGFPSRFPRDAIEISRSCLDARFRRELTLAEIKAGRFVPIGKPASEDPIELLVWGDSHAMAAATAFDRMLLERGVSGRLATHSSTAPVLGAYWHEDYGLNEDAIDFNEAIFDFIRTRRIRHVVLVAHWRRYADAKGTRPLAAALQTTVQRLAAGGTKPQIMLDTPYPGFNAPRAAAFMAIRQCDFSQLLTTAEILRRTAAGIDARCLAKLEALGATILDPKPAFLDADGKHFKIIQEGQCLYFDDHHLSVAGAELVLLPFLRRSMPDPRAGR